MDVARYRLRFLLQEFDLPRGKTVIGRSVDCNLTIEDPLVSRQHAGIALDEDGGTVEDMGSRNGVRVNGVRIQGATRLADGDRVRIGTQDFVFCRVEAAGKAHSRTTGVLRLCAECRLPYPREMISCPSCEATEKTEDTLTGAFGTENQTAWSVQLLVEALERALTLGRLGDAERLARRATGQVEELVAAGASIEPAALAALAIQAVATTLATNDPTWVLWTLEIYRSAGRVPSLRVVEGVCEAAAQHGGVLLGGLAALLQHLESADRSASPGDVDALVRLHQVHSDLEAASAELGVDVAMGDVGDASESEVTGEWPEP
jgi:hypothetical protein